jgi:geranylgeranyl pyrophosphate synthase
MSLPVLYALEELSEIEAKELRSILQEHTSHPEKKKRAINLIKKTKGIERANLKAQKLIKKAWDDLESVLATQEKTGNLSSLKELTHNFITRTK